MYHIEANKLTEDFLTSSGGLAIGQHIDTYFQNNSFNEVVVSFEGVENISPSFVNGVFLYLIDLYGEEVFREYVRVTKASPAVAETIRRSVSTYLERKKTFYSGIRLDTVFLVHDYHPKSESLIEKLKTVLENKNVRVLTADSTKFSSSDDAKIKNSDIVIVVINDDRPENRAASFIQHIVSYKKPCLLFSKKSGTESRIPTNYHEFIQPIYFEDENIPLQIKRMNELLAEKYAPLAHSESRNIPQNSDNGINLLIALGLLFILTLLFSESQKRSKRSIRLKK